MPSIGIGRLDVTDGMPSKESKANPTHARERLSLQIEGETVLFLNRLRDGWIFGIPPLQSGETHLTILLDAQHESFSRHITVGQGPGAQHIRVPGPTAKTVGRAFVRRTTALFRRYPPNLKVYVMTAALEAKVAQALAPTKKGRRQVLDLGRLWGTRLELDFANRTRWIKVDALDLVGRAKLGYRENDGRIEVVMPVDKRNAIRTTPRRFGNWIGDLYAELLGLTAYVCELEADPSTTITNRQ